MSSFLKQNSCKPTKTMICPNKAHSSKNTFKTAEVKVAIKLTVKNWTRKTMLAMSSPEYESHFFLKKDSFKSGYFKLTHKQKWNRLSDQLT